MKLLRLLIAGSPHALLFTSLLGFVAGVANMFALHALQTQIHASNVSLTLGVVFIAFLIVRVVLGHVSTHFVQDLALRVATELRRGLATRLSLAPLVEVERLGSARVHQLLTQQTMDVATGIMAIPPALLNGALLLASLAYLARLNVVPFLFALAGIAGGTIVQLVATVVLGPIFASSTNVKVEMQAHANAVLDGSTELRLSDARRAQFLVELEGTLAQGILAGRRLSNTLQSAISLGAIIMWAIVGLVVFVGPRFGAPSSSAVVVLFVAFPFGDLLDGWGTVSSGSFAYQRIEHEMQALTTTPSSTTPLPFDTTLSLVAVEHVYLDEHGDRFRLGPIDLSFRRGELVFLVGGNGSGKSTLAKLLVGLYPPLTGHVRVDELAVDDASRASYRQLFSAIFSNFHVFPKLLDPSPTRDAQLNSLLHDLGLARVVSVSDGKLSTLDLSTGQKKRLALACALLDDRPIYLFDEWAADQDPTWKQKFYEELLPLLRLRGKLVIVVTHDDRYFPLADRLIKLDAGRVVFDSRASSTLA